jgi:hypothetical protein
MASKGTTNESVTGKYATIGWQRETECSAPVVTSEEIISGSLKCPLERQREHTGSE